MPKNKRYKCNGIQWMRCDSVTKSHTKSLSSLKVVAAVALCLQMNWNNCAPNVFECLLDSLICLHDIPSSCRVQLCENDVRWHIYTFDIAKSNRTHQMWFILYTFKCLCLAHVDQTITQIGRWLFFRCLFATWHALRKLIKLDWPISFRKMRCVGRKLISYYSNINWFAPNKAFIISFRRFWITIPIVWCFVSIWNDDLC